MSQLTRTAYKNLYGTSGTTFPDNTTGQISEGDLRTFGEDSADSNFNKTDDAYTAAFPQVTAAGTDTYTATLSPAITAYATGQKFQVLFTNANTGAATLNFNSVGAKAIIKSGSVALVAGDIPAGAILLLAYDGTNLQLLGSGSSGGGTQDLQSVLDEGASANIGNSQADITADNGSNDSQWSITPEETYLSSSDSANTELAKISISTDGILINDTRANRGIQGQEDYSANIQANDFTQKIYVDTIDALKAPLASPTFTGTPAAPTAATNTDTTQIATTAFVNAEIAARAPKVIQVAVSDEVTSLTTGTAKVTFRMPYAMTLTAIRASLSTAQATGSILTIDINEGGTTILSTKLTIDNTEKTSVTAATAAVISDASLADNAEMTMDIDQIGDGTAKGLKIDLIGI